MAQTDPNESPIAKFERERRENIANLSLQKELKARSTEWLVDVCRHNYSYNFSWMGRPIIQFPQDIVALQELIWRIKPELIIETGIAHGGSLIFSASMLELLGGTGRVLGIDIDIRKHNREAIEAHRMFKRIDLIEGSSVAPGVLDQVRAAAAGKSPVMVILDSMHSHDHVLEELELYSPLVTNGSYLIVFDTVVEYMPDDFFPNRPWGQKNNPLTAVRAFLETNDRFEVDASVHDKLLITVAPEGYLRCVED